jgi:hypothetical protein
MKAITAYHELSLDLVGRRCLARGGTVAAQQEVDPNHFDSKPSTSQGRANFPRPNPARFSLKGAARRRAAARLKLHAAKASLRRQAGAQSVSNVGAAKGETK